MEPIAQTTKFFGNSDLDGGVDIFVFDRPAGIKAEKIPDHFLAHFPRLHGEAGRYGRYFRLPAHFTINRRRVLITSQFGYDV